MALIFNFIQKVSIITLFVLLSAPAVMGDAKNGLLAQSADPFVFKNSTSPYYYPYYLFTTNTNNMQIPIYRSFDFKQWTLIGDAMPVMPAWARKGFTWAPEVIEINGQYVIYYSARHKKLDTECLGSATSSRVDGPYTDNSSEPLICQVELGGSIDPSPFKDEDGNLYLLWKNDGNKLKVKTQIWIGALNKDGRVFKEQPSSLLVNDRPWEGINIEAPTLIKHNKKYYLFYSGAMFNSPRYAVGYAESVNLKGPYIKYNNNPILKTGKGVLAPGHQSIFRDHNNEYWMAFHTYNGRIKGGRRSTRVEKLEWINDVPQVQINERP